MKEPLRFLLGRDASERMAGSGQYFILQAYRSPQPEHAGRFIMLALPADKETCDACARIAKGTHKAIRVKAATRASTQPEAQASKL